MASPTARSPAASRCSALAIVAIGYPVQRHYLDHRFRNEGPREEWIPGYDLDSAYRWAQDIRDSRIGLAGTTAGFLQYGFYGADLSNEVVYLGKEGPHGAFNAIPTCREFVRARRRRRSRLPRHLALPQLHPLEADRLAGGPLAARRRATRPGRPDREAHAGCPQRAGDGLEGEREDRRLDLRIRASGRSA